MIVGLKNSCIFELRVIPNSNDAITETKTKRELTVASTAVIFMHRMGVARRDSLPLFNQKSFIMRANDVCANGVSKAISAESIIYSILSSDDPEHLRVHLRALMDAYLLQPEQDMAHAKGAVYSSFLILDDALQMIEEGRGK